MSQSQYLVQVTNQKGFPKFQLLYNGGSPIDTSSTEVWGSPTTTYNTSPISITSTNLVEADGATPFTITVSE